MIWEWYVKACAAKVKARGQQLKRCNMAPCCYQYMKIIDSTVTKKGIKIDGVKYSMMISVDNQTGWVNPIDTSVNECNKYTFVPVPSKKKNVDDYNSYWDCYETIPLYMYSLFDCSTTFA